MLRITAGDNLFVVVTDCGTGGRRIFVRFLVAEGDLSVLQLIRTGSRAVMIRLGKERWVEWDMRFLQWSLLSDVHYRCIFSGSSVYNRNDLSRQMVSGPRLVTGTL